MKAPPFAATMESVREIGLGPVSKKSFASPMPPRSFLALVVSFSLLTVSTPAADKPSADKPAVKKNKEELLKEFEAAIYDAKQFAASLPENILVCATVTSGKGAPPAKLHPHFQKGLTALRAYTQSKFIAFPENQSPAVAKSTSVPVYPPAQKQRGEEGAATLFLSISSTGEVVNIFVIDCTDPVFGTAGALSAARWKFKPAKIDQKAVPILMLLPMKFTINE